MAARMKKKIVDELKKLLEQRGRLTKAQLEYARVEEQAMNKMYPMAKPAEEIKFSPRRTLERYLNIFIR